VITAVEQIPIERVPFPSITICKRTRFLVKWQNVGQNMEGQKCQMTKCRKYILIFSTLRTPF
jgi:hypothetical protein